MLGMLIFGSSARAQLPTPVNPTASREQDESSFEAADACQLS